MVVHHRHNKTKKNGKNKSSALIGPLPLTKSIKKKTYFEILSESFTTNNKHEINSNLAKEHYFIRCLFILTNIGYIYIAYKIFIGSHRRYKNNRHQYQKVSVNPLTNTIDHLNILPGTNDITTNVKEFCYESLNYNPYFICWLGIVSTFFHTTQCFYCRNEQEIKRRVLYNKVDLSCAICYGLYLLTCFFKQIDFFNGIIRFLPCFILLIIGGIFKLKGYYKIYFLLHGLWHISSAYFFVHIICL